MRSGTTALAVPSRFLVLPLIVFLATLAGCGGASESKSYAVQSPGTGGGYPASPTSPRTESSGGHAAADVGAPQDAVRTVSANRRVALDGDDDEVAFQSADANRSAPEPAPPRPAPSQPQATQPGPATKAEKPEPAKEPAQTRDLVIYTARFTMAVYLVDQGLAAVEKIARDNGGFLGQKQDREITVRVPRGRFETTLAAIDKIGDVLHREIQAQDVTDEHVDLEIRIKNSRAMQKRLTELLAKASVKEALEIEKELHRVTQELELLEGRMKVLKDKIALSTITVVFTPRGAAIQTARVRLPFPWLAALNLPSLLSLSEDK